MKKHTKLIALMLAAITVLCLLAACGDRKQTEEGANTDPAASATPAPTDAPTGAPSGEHDGHNHEDEDLSKISIGRVGTVEYTMEDYFNIYQAYAPSAAYMTDMEGMIKGQLIETGALLTRCDELGIELDEDDEKALAERVDEELEYALSQMMIDQSIEGEQAIREARFRELESVLAEHGYTVERYLEEVRGDLTKTMRIEKLQQLEADKVEISPDGAERYYNEALVADKEKFESDPEAFTSQYEAYIKGGGRCPLYTPEDMFNVKHLLIQYENMDVVSETVEGFFGEEQLGRIAAVRSALEAGISFEDFYNKYVASSEYNDDTVFATDADAELSEQELAAYLPFREHGYTMNERLLNYYFDGFSVGSCLLYYGENWKLPEDIEFSAGSSDDLIGDYEVKFHETTDGVGIVECRSYTAGGGVHFIFISERLESGETKIDLGNDSDPVYASVFDEYKKKTLDESFAALLEEWKQNTVVELDEELIAHYVEAYFGGSEAPQG